MSHASHVSKPLRLERWLSQLGYIQSRRDADWFLEEHAVLVDGEPVERVDIKVVPSQVTIDGEPMDAEHLVILLHKPAGYVCSHEDAGLRVYDLLPDRWRARRPSLVTVGRLDKDTTGFLLLTDDGALTHRLTHPKHHVPKTYEVTLEKSLRGDEATIFAAGKLMLENETKPLLPAVMEVIDAAHVRLMVHEGRYHQVKRMFAAVGNHVQQLHRASMGGLDLGGLQPGKWRLLSAEDLLRLESNHEG